ncbi:MAG TPA: hypothetical protein VFR22_04805 [Nocardioidaceae bacterium]|nr:hypothetical protein [Nocardioidaceae bacterium]
MTTRRRVLWAIALVPWVVGATVWAVVQAVSAPPTPSPSPAEPAVKAIDAGASRLSTSAVQARAASPDWPAILDRLDRQRERAYAAEDPALLRAVYVSGSPVLRHDLTTLRAYSDRGVRLTGVRLRTLDVKPLGRSGPYVRLHVVDQLDRPTAHGADGTVRLPRDRATVRVIVLRDATDGWRIAAVRRAEA